MSEAPDPAELTKMWASIDVHMIDIPNAPLQTYLKELAKVYANGSVMYRSFQIGHHDAFEWYWSKNRLYEMSFFNNFMSSDYVRYSLHLGHVDEELDSQFILRYSLEMPFRMASALYSGGVYLRPEMTAVEVRELANAAVDTLIGRDYENTLFFDCYEPWTTFFMGSWDYTWVLAQTKERRVHVIIATDID
ncbi:hypothetical protein [Desulfovibrio sp. X2]|uniref:hypothetical protein n=1 Tax=Desulfovibrio sp. X2 TaxID=941449 RepID=UPI0005514873|nr:hypothetical protein [Desulfovibrio sp. X2]